MGNELTRLGGCVVLALCSAVSSRAGDIPIVEGVPDGFELVRLTDDPEFQHSLPEINDCSEVVFGRFDSDADIWNTFIFSNGRIRQLTFDDTLDWNPTINNQSDMAWNQKQGVGQPRDLVTTFTADPIDGENDAIGFIDMNDRRDVTWQRVDDTGEIFDILVYTSADGLAHQITDGGDNQSPRMNNAGQVIWRLKDTSVSPWVGRIMMYSNGIVTDITPGECQCQQPDINDTAHAVWADEVGIHFWDGNVATFIASIAATPRINNSDEIAFALWDNTDQIAKHSIFKNGTIYVLPNFGLSTARLSLNNLGEVAMRSQDLNTGNMQLFLLRRVAPKGDFNHDCRVDLYDSWILQRCGTAEPGPEGTLLAECIRGDFDDDGDVDPEDWSAFVTAFTGPGATIDGCEP